MLNRFKSAIYGSSSTTDLDAIQADNHSTETLITKRLRNALTKSTSFRDDLIATRFGYGNETTKTNDVRSNEHQTFQKQDHKNDYKQAQPSLTTTTTTSSSSNSRRQNNPKSDKMKKFPYSRPEFLNLKSEEEIHVSSDHYMRPIILPRDISRLPWKTGYAECVNAGKSPRNEDQAVFYQDVLIKRSAALQSKIEPSKAITIEDQLPWFYFGIFDGHAGSAVAVAAAAQLHHIIKDKLSQISDLLLNLEFGIEEEVNESEPIEIKDYDISLDSSSTPANGESQKEETISPAIEPTNADSLYVDSTSCEHPKARSLDSVQDEKLNGIETNDNQKSNSVSSLTSWIDSDVVCPSIIDICRQNVTVDSLIIGALESAFWDMDSLIERDKQTYKMPGGCTALVSIFIMGKLYVCNAGDSRAIVRKKGGEVVRMSNDFTPISERQRILRLGMQFPQLLGTKYTHLQFARQPTRRDLGKQMLYKDAYMTGWSLKTITYDDLKVPLVWGEGKRSRVLATIGVTRGFGDQELRAAYGSLAIKPFLTPEPEVRVLQLEHDSSIESSDFLIMASDGLWDVTSDQEAVDIVEKSFNDYNFTDDARTSAEYRFLTAAQDLVIHSRGENYWRRWKRMEDGGIASLDDISVFVIPLKYYKDEYVKWKTLRSQARQRTSLRNKGSPSNDESNSGVT